jgi:hypothetical protein
MLHHHHFGEAGISNANNPSFDVTNAPQVWLEGDKLSLQPGDREASWNLEAVRATRLSDGARWWFWCGTWLGSASRQRHEMAALTSDPRGRAVRYKVRFWSRDQKMVVDGTHCRQTFINVLHLGARPLAMTSPLLSWTHTPARVPTPHDWREQVTTFTGSVLGAAASSHVYIDLSGSAGSSGPLELRPVPGGSNAFAPGVSASFVVSMPTDLGDLCRLRVWHDGAGPSPGWHLDRAEVQHCGSGKVG